MIFRRTWSAARFCVGFAALSCASAPEAASQCRQALALGLDVSASVDAVEYRLQLDGLSEALASPRVQQKLFAMPSAPVELLVFEWSGVEDQHVLIEWTPIKSSADLDIIRATLGQVRRREAAPGTALGRAMTTGADHLMRRANCWKKTLDISGDGKANAGKHPNSVRDTLGDQGITINALVIGADAPSFGDVRQTDIAELSAYYRAHVITGPDAFVQTALGYEAYAEAMRRKLERELEGLVVSSAAPMRLGRR